MKKNSPQRLRRRRLQKASQQYPSKLVYIPRDSWPADVPPGLLKVYRSNQFLVQIYAAAAPALYRLSIHRTEIDLDGRWRADITWDELQEVKNQAGFASHEAVEIFPAAEQLVNVANIRHLWVLENPLGFSWKIPDLPDPGGVV